LVNDRLSSRANLSGQAGLRELQLTTEDPQPHMVVVRHLRQGRRTRWLPRESAVMDRHEPFASCSGGESDRPTEGRPHGEMRLQSSGPNCGLQGSDMDVEFLRKLIERQSLVLSRMMGDHVARALQHCWRDGSTPAVPGAERLEWGRQQCGERALSKTNGAAQIANLRHAAHTMPLVAADAKRPAAFMADDQRCLVM
jgi:hypothetical protein